MKLQIHSDIHLEFEDYKIIPDAEILILAGDVIVAEHLTARNGDRAKRYVRFFKYINNNFKKVFYVLGNHEHYDGRIENSKKLIMQMLSNNKLNNFTVLEQSSEIYNDILFIGGTLWTDCNKEDGLTMFHLKSMMNDYSYIRTEERNFSRFQPEDSVKIHKKTKEYFNIVLSNSNYKSVMITHHAPSPMSIGYYHNDDYLMNGGYASDMSNVILDYNPSLWIHGHMHHSVDYMIGETRVISNPKGYPNEKSKSYSNLIVEV